MHFNSLKKAAAVLGCSLLAAFLALALPFSDPRGPLAGFSPAPEKPPAPLAGSTAAALSTSRVAPLSQPLATGGFASTPAEAFESAFNAMFQQGDRRFAFGPVRQQHSGPREFYFTRAIYSGWRSYRWGSWATDFPKADRQFLWGLRRLTNIDAYEFENALQLTDPELRRYPFLYALEVGYMSMGDDEVEAVRNYLFAGGFLFIDDFWGTREWQNFEYEIRRVLPDHKIVEMPMEHPIFTTFYEITEIKQVPGVRHAWYGGPTWERDGYVPYCLGIFDENERLMVLINWNTDLGDAWEWAEDPYYPLPLSTFAYQLAVNAIVYAMSH